MKSVLISIKPKWCELIANGKKTIEVRKTRPKIKTPFKCYIYCTKGDALAYPCANHPAFNIHRANDGTIKGRQMTQDEMKNSDYTFANGKVVGEFECDIIYEYKYDYCTHPEIGMDYDCGDNWYEVDEEDLKKACLDYKDFYFYGNHRPLYGWHISDLKIYEEPKELIKFKFFNSVKDRWNKDRNRWMVIKKAPQSWCYVESLEE